MPGQLDDDEIQEILDAYEEHGSYRAAADAVDRSKNTVAKYVKEYGGKDEADSDGGAGGDDGAPEGFTAQPPEGVDVDEGPDFERMDYGEFIKWFFDQDGYGVAETFVNTLASTCDVRGKIPDKAEMANELMSSNSRINNSHQAERIAEVYWDAAQRYLRSQGQNPGMGQHQRPVGVGGSWQGGQPTADGGATTSGQWTGSSQQGGQGQRQTSQTQSQGWQAQPPQNQQQAQGRPAQSGTDPQLRDAITDLQKTQTRILQQLEREQQRDEQDSQKVKSLKQQAKEVVEAQQAIESMANDDDKSSAELQQLREDIRQINQKVEQAGAEAEGGESEMTTLMQMAAQDDIDPETLGVLTEAMGVTDPEVKKAEVELQKQERKLESRQQMIDMALQGLGDVSGDLVGAVMDALQERKEQQRQQPPPQTQQQHPHQHPQQHPQQGQPQATPPQQSQGPPGGKSDRVGEPTVVGEDVGTGGGQQRQERPEPEPHQDRNRSSGVSPAKEKFQERVGDGGNDGGGRGRERRFRGPGGGDPTAAENGEAEDADEDSGGIGAIRSAGEEDAQPDGGTAAESGGPESTGRCQWVQNDGTRCENDAPADDVLCATHREQVGEEEV